MFNIFGCSRCKALQNQNAILQEKVSQMDTRHIDDYWHHKELEERIEQLTIKLAQCMTQIEENNEEDTIEHTGE